MHFFCIAGLGSKVGKSPGVSVECGVCGAVRFHRLTKQSLKFGLICCDPCRKFIAKMMLRSKSSENSVPCDNGQGNYRFQLNFPWNFVVY